MNDNGHDFLTTEECFLTLNYAWYHIFGCSLLMGYLYAIGETRHFEAGHNFGIFGLLADYGVMYLTKGTRTIRVLPHSNGIDVDELYGIGTFLYFGWFDYLGGFCLMVFARNISEAIATGKFTRTNAFVIVQHALMWWTAPLFTVANKYNNDTPPMSEWLNIDDRRLITARESSKSTYLVLLVTFSALLWKTTSCTKKHYSAVLVSGLACGSLHHLALFVFGMRGYDSLVALGVTLATEWPALMCGEAWMRLFLGSKYSQPCRRFLLVVLVAILFRNLPNDEELTEFLISVIPGQHMQSFGTNVLRAKTCFQSPRFFRLVQSPPEAPIRCTDLDDDSIWVISTPAKSGAVLSAKILLDIATECNLCLAMGTRDTAGIPGPGTHVPTFRGKLLHALMDMDEWPSYVEAHSPSNASRCVSMTRDPLNRLRSFYTYSRSGGEHWVRYETNIMKSLRSAPTLKESVRWFWENIGKTYLVASHESYKKDENRGCYQIRFEDLTRDYDGTIRRILRVFAISSSSAEDHLVRTLGRHDRSRATGVVEELLAKDMHVSSKKFSKELIAEVERILMNDIEEARTLIRNMRTEMELLTPAHLLSSSSEL